MSQTNSKLFVQGQGLGYVPNRYTTADEVGYGDVTVEDALDELVESAEKSAMTELSDTEPYVLRQGKGDLVDLELIGGSVGWNQLVQNGNFASTSNWTASNGTLAVNNNIATVTATGTNNQGVYQSIKSISGHKYLVSTNVKINTSNSFSNVRFVLSNGGIGNEKGFTISANTRTTAATVLSATDNWSTMYFIGTYSGSNISVNDTIEISNINMIDLTQLFGSEVADYIHSLEHSTAGDGVAFFRKYFPNAYYAYDAGSIQSVCTSGRKVIGKNLFDQRVFNTYAQDATYISYQIPNGTYVASTNMPYVSNVANVFVFSGIATSGASSLLNGVTSTHPVTFTVIDGYYTIAYRSTSVNTNNPKDFDFQIESGSTITPYEPYTSTICAFDSTKQLRGIPKLVDNELNYEGDVYEADGSITRKYGIVDLGSLSWSYAANWGQQKVSLFYATLESSSRRTINNAICAKYPVVPVAIGNNLSDDSMVIGSPYISGERTMIGIADNSYSDAATFKTAMSGVYLVYELATPTTESASAYQNPQRCYSAGTEQFIDGITRDVMVPVGNTSKYTSNEVIPVVEDYVDGKFTHGTITRRVVTGGYVTASGNYFTCSVPLRTKSTSITIDSIGDANTAYTTGGIKYTAFTATGSTVDKIYSDYIIITLKFNTSQTANSICSAAVDITFTLN